MEVGWESVAETTAFYVIKNGPIIFYLLVGCRLLTFDYDSFFLFFLQ